MLGGVKFLSKKRKKKEEESTENFIQPGCGCFLLSFFKVSALWCSTQSEENLLEQQQNYPVSDIVFRLFSLYFFQVMGLFILILLS